MAGKVQIRDVVPADLVALFTDMREGDFDEVQAARGDVWRALKEAIQTSVFCKAAEVDGKLLALFGVAPISFLNGEGSPWLLGTTHLRKHRGFLMRESRRYLPSMLEIFPHLSNYVDARNVNSIRYLEALGFTMHAPAPHGTAGLPFHPFSMDVPNV